MITKAIAASALLAYMRHQLSFSELLNWAEHTLLEANFSDEDMDILTQVLSRLGLADVRALGLSWEDCEELVHLLGHRLQVQLVASA